YSPMVDLSFSKTMGALLREAMQRKIVVAAICHGPAAFLAAKNEKDWPFAGPEEKEWLKKRSLPWTVQSRLTEAGAKWEGAGNWSSKVVRDGNLITAQSSPSTDEFVKTILDALR